MWIISDCRDNKNVVPHKCRPRQSRWTIRASRSGWTREAGSPAGDRNRGALQLPISPTSVPATCGQSALRSNMSVYIAQAVVDTSATPSNARGILRTALDPVSGALIGPSAYMATTSGLDGISRRRSPLALTAIGMSDFSLRIVMASYFCLPTY